MSNAIIYPRADSDSRQERIMSEWAITNIIRILSGKISEKYKDGTFRVNESGTEFCIHGYYCKVDSVKDQIYYLPVEIKEGWFQIAGDLTTTKPDGTEGEDYFSIDLDRNSKDYAPLLNFLNYDYKPYIIQSEQPMSEADKRKIWINTSNDYNIINVFDENSKKWIKIGAVYK